MAKYLFQASLTESGLKGTLKEGGSKRKEAVTQAVMSMNGTVEAYYYAFGKTDVFCIADLPDNVSAAALALMITAAGGATISTTVLITPEEADQAAKKTIAYRAPGK